MKYQRWWAPFAFQLDLLSSQQRLTLRPHSLRLPYLPTAQSTSTIKSICECGEERAQDQWLKKWINWRYPVLFFELFRRIRRLSPNYPRSDRRSQLWVNHDLSPHAPYHTTLVLPQLTIALLLLPRVKTDHSLHGHIVSIFGQAYERTIDLVCHGTSAPNLKATV